MSEVIFKNEYGEYRVGDKVAFVKTPYKSTIFGVATIVGITNGRLIIEQEKARWVYLNKDGEEWDYRKNRDPGRSLRDACWVCSNTRDVFVKTTRSYMERSILVLNRVIPAK